MSDLSEDDSSDDSSKEFLVDSSKIQTDSGFFPSPKKTGETQQSNSTDGDTDEDDLQDATKETHLDIFSQVLQNLQSVNANSIDEKVKAESSGHSKVSATQSFASSNEITELLLKGETATGSSRRDTDDDNESEKDESGGLEAEYSIPKEGVKITLPGTSFLLPKKKKGSAPDPLAALRKHFREIQLLVVKVSLLCWLAHGFHLNRLINEPEIMAVSLSLLASCNYPSARVDIPYLEKFTKWFSSLFKLEASPNFTCTNKELLLNCARDKKVTNYSELVLLYIALLRGMGLNCRLISCLCPPRQKLPESLMTEAQKKMRKVPEKKMIKKEVVVKGSEKKNKSESAEELSPKKESVFQNSLEAEKTAREDAKKRAAAILKGGTKEKTKASSSTVKKTLKNEVDKQSSHADEKTIKKVESPDKDMKQKAPALRKLRSNKTDDSSSSELKRTENNNAVLKPSNKIKEDNEDLKEESVAQTSQYKTRSRQKRLAAKETDDTTSKYYKTSDTKDDSVNIARKNNRRNKTVVEKKTAIDEEMVSKYYKKEEKHVKMEHVEEKRKPTVKRNSRAKANKEDHSTMSKHVKESNSTSEEEFSPKKKPRTRKDTKASSTKNSDKSEYIDEEDTDSEEEFKPTPPRKPVKRTVKANADQKSKSRSKAADRRILSSESEDNEGDSLKNENLWAEVYLDSEESWISVCVPDAKVHCISELYKKAKKPVLYVIAWNSEGLIKDVTRRYTPNWLTVTRKKRIDEKWFSKALSPWKEKNTTISRAEDEMLLEKELAQPLPQTVGECKGHPLYALARHLLKYEAFYPPDCVPLGRTKTGEAIYSRHCVHVLRSRETWIRHARVVKPNQEAYKVVKALPKYDKLSGAKIKGATLELFGEWQTTKYIPPVAKDGLVPRNEYGNVDLYQQSMLPTGTVHINLPGLNRIARKLDIDCAPAVVGFNFGGMGAVPAFEGYIVCEEFEDTLREAWEAEQIEARKRAREKREKRIYGNWKRLIQGLLIRERLAAKYEFKDESKPTAKRSKQNKTDAKKSKAS